MAEETKTAEQELEELKAAAEAAGKKPDEQKPVSITLGDGSTYEAATPEELLQKVAQAKVDTSTAMRSREDENKELRRQNKEAAEAARAPKHTETTGFDNSAFLDQIDKDGSAAVVSGLEHHLGLEPGEFKEQFNRQGTAAEEFIQNSHMQAFFARCQDYPGGDESAKLICDLLDSSNRKYTADNMESAFRELEREGKIKALDIKGKGAETTKTGPNPPPQLTTTGGGAGSPMDDIQERFNKMTVDEQREFLTSPEYQKWVQNQQPG